MDSQSSASCSSAAWILASWPPCSPFVSLTALSALIFMLIPNELLISSPSSSSSTSPSSRTAEKDETMDTIGGLMTAATAWIPRAIIPAEEEFACGGGPFSFTAASLISISCDRSQIHLCCEVHDVCYEQYNISQQHCDDAFCACMQRIRHSAWCDNIAQPGLCLATRTFGHLFHWSSKCNALQQQENDAEGLPEPEECRHMRRWTSAEIGLEQQHHLGYIGLEQHHHHLGSTHHSRQSQDISNNNTVARRESAGFSKKAASSSSPAVEEQIRHSEGGHTVDGDDTVC